MPEEPFHDRVVPLRRPGPTPVASVQGTLALALGGTSEPYEPPLTAVADLAGPGRHEL
jgi:hypothetical protein